MASVMRNFIEIEGINTNCIPKDATSFKQFNVEETVCIPVAKPDIEQIIKIIVESEITSTRSIANTSWKIIRRASTNRLEAYS